MAGGPCRSEQWGRRSLILEVEEHAVIEDRPTRTKHEPVPLGAVPKRLQQWLRRHLTSEPALPRPRSLRLEPIRRSWPGAFWQARISVRAGVSLDDYLRSRLARYLSD